MKPAKRLTPINEYYFSTKLKEIARRNIAGEGIINLGIGSPDMPPPESVIATLIETASATKNHSYQSYRGIPELRKAIKTFYLHKFNVSVDDASEILPLIGSKEGIMHISMAFLNEGDHVLVPNPGYMTYAAAGKLAGATVIYYDLKHENNWFPDIHSLEKQDLSKVKLMWINYPNMPTGTTATLAQFKELIAFAKHHNILIVNDNPYSFVLNDNPKSLWQIEGSKSVTMELNSLSKSHNMA